MIPKLDTTSQALRDRLDLLHAELAVANGTALSADSAYMLDLRAELNEVYSALAMASVMEIAITRAQQDGPLQG